jgi:fluoride exporter
MIKEFLLVGLGGAIGSIMRYSITLISSFVALPSLIGTLTANVLGSIIIGIIVGSCDKGSFYLFAAIGVCGGFTTFSTFSSQSLSLLQTGRYSAAMLYIAASVIICLLSVWIGLKIGHMLE